MDDLATAIDSTDDSASIEASLSAAFGPETATETPANDGAVSAQPSPAVSGEATPAALEAPKHWSEADRGLFGKAPREIQERWIARETEQQKGLDAKFQEIAAFRKEREQLDELFSPYSRDLELRGTNRTQFIQSLLGAHKFLLEKPADALKWLAQEYGIDLTKLNEAGKAPDPVTQEVKQLRDELGRFTAQQREQQTQTNLAKVKAFAEAKDDRGNALHPYFDEVGEDITALMKSGAAKDLDTAYNKAIRMNDAVYEKVQADKAKAKAAADDAARKAEIDKAKRAGKTSAASQANGSSRPSTLEEDLAARFANWGT